VTQIDSDIESRFDRPHLAVDRAICSPRSLTVTPLLEVVASGGPEARARGLDHETSVWQSLGGIPFGEDGKFSLGLAEGVGQAE